METDDMLTNYSLEKCMQQRIPNRQKKSGFTLIELSIVLVIIGLIVGGILIGQDLIKAAKLRATITQVERYSTAVRTFQFKYNALPGDITQADQFGMASRIGTGVGHGDNNGLIEGGGGPTGSSVICGETALFWNDLGVAGLIENTNLTGADGTSGVGLCPSVPIASVLPPAKLGNGSFFTVYSDSGINYFQMLQSGDNINIIGMPLTAQAAITPLEAFQLDSKADDGLPLQGTVQAYGDDNSGSFSLDPNGPPAADIPAVPAPEVCVSNAAGNPYNTEVATGANTNACSPRFRFN